MNVKVEQPKRQKKKTVLVLVTGEVVLTRDI